MVQLSLQVLRALPQHGGEGVQVADHQDEEQQGGDDDPWGCDVVQS